MQKSRPTGSESPIRIEPRQGPLWPHLDDFAALLAEQGYCKTTARNKIRLVADLSRWLEQTQVPLNQLGEERITVFLRWRWKHLVRKSGDLCTLALLVRHLREKDIISPPAARRLRPIDLIERAYGRFLREERGFSPGSVGQYFVQLRIASWNAERSKSWNNGTDERGGLWRQRRGDGSWRCCRGAWNLSRIRTGRR